MQVPDSPTTESLASYVVNALWLLHVERLHQKIGVPVSLIGVRDSSSAVPEAVV